MRDRHVPQSIVLHEQVAEAIEDRVTVADLDAHQDMRPVRREDIGAGVDATPREIADEIGLFNDLGAVTDDMLSRLAKQASAPRRPRKFGSLNTARAARWHDIAAKRDVDSAMFSIVEHRKVRVNDSKVLLLPTIRELCLGCQVYSLLS